MAKDFSSIKDNKKVGTFFIPSLLEGTLIKTYTPERYKNQTVDCCNYDITDILKSQNIQNNVPAAFSNLHKSVITQINLLFLMMKYLKMLILKIMYQPIFQSKMTLRILIIHSTVIKAMIVNI